MRRGETRDRGRGHFLPLVEGNSLASTHYPHKPSRSRASQTPTLPPISKSLGKKAIPLSINTTKKKMKMIYSRGHRYDWSPFSLVQRAIDRSQCSNQLSLSSAEVMHFSVEMGLQAINNFFPPISQHGRMPPSKVIGHHSKPHSNSITCSTTASNAGPLMNSTNAPEIVVDGNYQYPKNLPKYTSDLSQAPEPRPLSIHIPAVEMLSDHSSYRTSSVLTNERLACDNLQLPRSKYNINSTSASPSSQVRCSVCTVADTHSLDAKVAGWLEQMEEDNP